VRHAFKPDATRKKRAPRGKTSGSGGETARAYWCAACTTRLASEADAIAVGGAHRHRFVNPDGVAFEIGCFQKAACRVDGEPTDEATWFAGFAWSYAACANCRTQLGWCYEGDAGRFFGLILPRLVGPL
jgi:hypothetical protein